jgi:hypothetical protein
VDCSPRTQTPRDPSRRTLGARTRALVEARPGLLPPRMDGGAGLLPWQGTGLDTAREVLDDGTLAYSVVIVSVPRRCGKTEIDSLDSVTQALTTLDYRGWYTAQTRADAFDNWDKRIVPLHRHLGGREAWQTVRDNNKPDLVFRPSGGSIRPFTPSAGALHGKLTHRVSCDECWAYTVEQGSGLVQAIGPTQDTVEGHAQKWYLSTAGDSSSEWWQSRLEAVRLAVAAGMRTGTCLIDHGFPIDDLGNLAPDVDPLDPAVWAVTHPAYGRTVGERALRRALADDFAGDVVEFARAYGNVPSGRSRTAPVIPPDMWAAAADHDQARPTVPVHLGVDVDVDDTSASIVAAWTDGPLVRVELVDFRPGTAWVPGRVRELVTSRPVAQVVTDSRGPAGAVVAEADADGPAWARMATGDVTAAAAIVLGRIAAGGLRYRPDADLDRAAAAAVKRPVVDAWTFGRRASDVPISPLVAATAAAWSVITTPRPFGLV